MTALVSKIDFHNFGKYYLYAVKRLRACLLIQAIAALLSYPMAALAANITFDFGEKWSVISEAYQKNYPNVSREIAEEWEAMQQQEDAVIMLIMVVAVIAVIALVTMLFMHFMVPLVSYRRLYRKTYADMDFSLPVSADGMFWGDFLAGATVTVLPHLVGIMIGIISMQPLYGYSEMYSVEVLYSILDNDVIPLVFTVFLAAIMLYAMTVFIVGLCGKRFHAVAVPILVNIVVPVTHYLMFYLGQSYAAGNWFSSVYMLERSIFVTSPLGMAFSTFFAAVTVSEGFGAPSVYFSPVNYYPIQQPRYLIPALVVILLLILGAWLVIRRRRAEQTGARAFAVKPAQYVIHGLTALAIATVAAWNISRSFERFWGSMSNEPVTPHIYDIINVYSILLLIAIPAVYLILEVAAGERKRFGWSLARCGGTTAAAAGITLAVMCCNAFGMSQKAPNLGNVGAVDVYIDQANTQAHFRYDLKERESIEMIAGLQNSIKSEYEYGSIFKLAERVNDGSLIGVNRLELEYYSYDGTRKDYAIEISDETVTEVLHGIAVPEAMANKCFEFQRNAGELTGVIVNENGEQRSYPLAKSGLTADMLREAVRKDCENVTYERMFDCEAGNISSSVYFTTDPEMILLNQPMMTMYDSSYVLDTNESGRVTVYPWFDNTIALLKEYGVEVDFGLDTGKYNTAFLVRSIPTEDEDTTYYHCYSGLRTSLPILFGLAGDESFIPYYRYEHGDGNGVVTRYDEEKDERVPMEDDEIIDQVRSECKYLQAADIGMDKAAELYPLCGSVYDAETDYGSDHYLLVLADVEDGDIARDGYNINEFMSVFIPAEHFDKAAEMFNAAYVD